MSMLRCPTDLNSIVQGPTVLLVGADGNCLDIFPLVCLSFFMSLEDGTI